MKMAEYSVSEMKTILDNMSGMYDMARVVDPIECRILNFRDDGTVSMNESCYGIWNAGQKCTNCSSTRACRTGCHQVKDEHFNDNIYHIQSNPVRLRLPDGGVYDAVVELASVERDEKHSDSANDRAAENVDHQAAQYQAVHDSLTKVLNADSFYERARNMIVKSPDQSWVMVTSDIMNFSLINNLFGVRKGNEVLVETTGMLRRVADEAGGLCGRLGGDQFAILLPSERYQEEKLRTVAEKLAASFSSGIFTFSIHFGVYRVSEAFMPVSVMCGRANTALHTIRNSMRETIAYFDSEMLKKSLFEQEIISGFEDALKKSEFQMFLQPLAEADGTIYGAEALVRWFRPDGTVIMPGDFVEILEQAGLIHALDKYIWEQAVKQLSMWKGTDKGNLSISVNMSAKDFYNLDICRVFDELIKKYEVDSRLLRVEITETALLDEPERSNEVVSELRSRGFLVEIDDFGKGYSSLNMLKHIHADVLKIDMSLMQEIESKARSKIILQSIMANDLEMDVITEGVETEEQLSALVGMGCRHFQGYYFSSPLTVPEFEKIL